MLQLAALFRASLMNLAWWCVCVSVCLSGQTKSTNGLFYLSCTVRGCGKKKRAQHSLYTFMARGLMNSNFFFNVRRLQRLFVRLRIAPPSGEHATCIKRRLLLRDLCVATFRDGCLVTVWWRIANRWTVSERLCYRACQCFMTYRRSQYLSSF